MDESEQENEYDYDIDDGEDEDPRDDYDVPDDDDDMDEDDDDNESDTPLELSATINGVVNELRIMNREDGDAGSLHRRLAANGFPFENVMMQAPMMTIAPRESALRSFVLETFDMLAPNNGGHNRFEQYEMLRLAEPLQAVTSRLRGSMLSSLPHGVMREPEYANTIHPYLQRPCSATAARNVFYGPLSTSAAVTGSAGVGISPRRLHAHGASAQERRIMASAYPGVGYGGPGSALLGTDTSAFSVPRSSQASPVSVSGHLPSVQECLGFVQDLSALLETGGCEMESAVSQGGGAASGPVVSPVRSSPADASAPSPTDASYAVDTLGAYGDNRPWTSTEERAAMQLLADEDLLRSTDANRSRHPETAFVPRARGHFGRTGHREREKQVPAAILRRWSYDPLSHGGDSLPGIFSHDNGSRSSHQAGCRPSIGSPSQPIIATENYPSVSKLNSKVESRLEALTIQLKRNETRIKNSIATLRRRQEDRTKAEEEAKEKTGPETIAAERSDGDAHGTAARGDTPATVAPAQSLPVPGEGENPDGTMPQSVPEPEPGIPVGSADDGDRPLVAEHTSTAEQCAEPIETERVQPNTTDSASVGPSEGNVVAQGVEQRPDPAVAAPSGAGEVDGANVPTGDSPGESGADGAVDFAAVAVQRAAAAGISLDAPANENPDVLAAAMASTGIDPTFLAALPDEMRAEVLTEYYERLTAPSAVQNAEAPSTTTVNQDFLVALPPALRAEVLELEAEFQARHNNTRGGTGGGAAEGNGQRGENAGDSTGGIGAAADMDNATFLATLTSDLREEILLTSGEAFLASLPPAMAAEARVLREREQMNSRMPWRVSAEEAMAAFGQHPFPNGLVNSSTPRDHRNNARRSQPMEPSGFRWQKGDDGRWYRVGPSGLSEPIRWLSPDGLSAIVQLLWVRQAHYGKNMIYQVLSHACKNGSARSAVLDGLLGMVTSDQRTSGDGSSARDHLAPTALHGTAVRRALELLTSLCKSDSVVAETLIGLREVPTTVKLESAPQPARDEEPNEKKKSFVAESRPSLANLSTLMSLLKTPLFLRSNIHLEQLVVVISSVCQAFPPEKAHPEPTHGARTGAGPGGHSTGHFARRSNSSGMIGTEALPGWAREFANNLFIPADEHEGGGDESFDIVVGSPDGPGDSREERPEPESGANESGENADEAAGDKDKKTRDANAIVPVQDRIPALLKGELCALVEVLIRPGCSERTYERASKSLEQLGELPENCDIMVALLAEAASRSSVLIKADFTAFARSLKEVSSSLSGARTGGDIAEVTSSDQDENESRGQRRSQLVSAFSMASASSELTLLRLVKTVSGLLSQSSGCHPPQKSPVPDVPVAALANASEEEDKDEVAPVVLTPTTAAGTEERSSELLFDGLHDLWVILDDLLDLVAGDVEGQRREGGAAKDGRAGGSGDNSISPRPAPFQTTNVLRLDRIRGAHRSLSPVLARLSPVIEAYLVTHTAKEAVAAEDEASKKRETVPQTPPPQVGHMRASGSPAGSSAMSDVPESTASLPDKGKDLSVFIERHRVPINALLRANPLLLETSFRGALRHAHAIDFDNKKAYFRNLIRRRSSEAHAGTIRINVRRDRVFDDSYHQLRVRTPDEMKGRLHVQFVGEEGVDAGGVTREWYIILARQIFDPNYALFCRSAAKAATYQPDKRSYINREHLENFRFVGRVIGKAIYDGQLLDAYFTRSFYKHILGVKPTYHDIEAQDPDYYKSLKWMLENDITGVLDHNMSAEYGEFGVEKVMDLLPNGRNIPVTEENKAEYVRLVTEVRMTKAIEKQIEAFKEGFHELIPREDVRIFNELELELLMSGLPDIDMADLKANVEYTGYTAASPQVNWFWRTVSKMDQEDLARLVMFVTGTSKVPLEGFSALQGMNGTQKFQIHRVAGDTLRLPSAHTCFNQLDLPEYSSAEILSERLLRAVRECSVGFGFA